MADNHNVNARITSANRRAADEFQYKSHSEDGVYFLIGAAAGAAPTGLYYGVYVLADAVVASITDVDSVKNGNTTSITDVTLLKAGSYISLPGLFTTLTLTSGEVQLLKYKNKS